MLEYIDQQQNTKEAKFIGPPGSSARSYGNRFKCTSQDLILQTP